MGKVLKYVLGSAAVLVLVAGIIVYVVLTKLDGIIKEQVETIGPQATGTPVTLGGVHVSVFSGEGSMRRLRIGNPEGFQSDYAFELDSIDLAVDLTSLMSDVIVVESIAIDGARLSAEQKGNRINLNDILNNVERYSGPSEEGSDGDGEADDTRIIVRQFRFSNGEVSVRSDLFEGEKSVAIPEVVLKGIGEKTAGVTIAEATQQMVRPIVNGAVQAAKQEFVTAGKEELKKRAEEEIGKALEKEAGAKLKDLLRPRDD